LYHHYKNRDEYITIRYFERSRSVAQGSTCFVSEKPEFKISAPPKKEKKGILRVIKCT
jgi:hypothetical protein